MIIAWASTSEEEESLDWGSMCLSMNTNTVFLFFLHEIKKIN